MEKASKIFVAGSNGTVGSAIIRELIKCGFTNNITNTSKELDLRNQNEVATFFKLNNPDYVFLTTSKVEEIYGNTFFPSELSYDNLIIQNDIIQNSYLNNVKKLLFLGSSFIYLKSSEQPINEEYLLSGKLEPTNEVYAIAKIAGVEMCKFYKKKYGCNFISGISSNLYVINNNFNSFNKCH